jgi:hypothetical protein
VGLCSFSEFLLMHPRCQFLKLSEIICLWFGGVSIPQADLWFAWKISSGGGVNCSWVKKGWEGPDFGPYRPLFYEVNLSEINMLSVGMRRELLQVNRDEAANKWRQSATNKKERAPWNSQ